MKFFKIILFLLFFFIQLSFSSYHGSKYLKMSSIHNEWNSMLKEFVIDGRVDYLSWGKEANNRLNEYLTMLKTVPEYLFKKASNAEKLAFYINTYNAYTVRLIIDNPDVESIRDISSPWKKKFLLIKNKKKSLNDLEHKIIRKYFKEPRIHFALVCASVSCPALKPYAFIGDKLEQQLSEASRDFLSDESKNKFTGDKSSISKIFKWYGEDFKNLKGFFKKYAPKEFNEYADIEYLEYDWNLNSL